MYGWISKMYSNIRSKTNSNTGFTTPVSNAPTNGSPYTRSQPQVGTGTMYYDTNVNAFMVFDGKDWRKSVTVPANSGRKSLLDELDKEDYSDILETVLLILMRHNLVSDINEFKEMLDAAKLARQITNGDETL